MRRPVAGPLLALLGLAVALGLLGAPTAAAETGRWSEPVKLSTGSDGWFPDVAADDRGNVHAIWSGTFSDVQDRYESSVRLANSEGSASASMHDVAGLFYSRFDGRAWTKPNDIAVIWVGNALRSALAVDQSGRLHLTYKGFGRLTPESASSQVGLGSEHVWYSSASDGRAETLASWLAPRRLTRSLIGYFSDVAVDRRGVVHAIWTENDRGGWGIFYAQSSDGGLTWSRRVALDTSETGNYVWWYRAHLEIDARDRLHVVWEITSPKHLGITRGAMYARSDDGGTTWSTVRLDGDGATSADQSLDARGPGAQAPSIGVDGQGETLLVFRQAGSEQILYRRSSDGQSWSAPAPIANVKAGVPRPYDIYDMATDSAGHVHLVLVGYPVGADTMALLHVEWDGQNWSSPDVIATPPPYPEYPRLAVGQGNRLHVVWFARATAGVGADPLGVWYSAADTTAPRTTRAGEAAPAPATPTAAVTHRPLPRLAADESTGRSTRPVGAALGPIESDWTTALRGGPGFPIVVAALAVAALVVSALAARRVHAAILGR